MYAVIKTGGKQYRVASGEKIKIEQIAADVGAQIVLDQVLMVADGDAVKLGTPLVSGATVTATVVAHGRGDEGEDLQDAPPQALPEDARAIARTTRKSVWTRSPKLRSRHHGTQESRRQSSRNGRDSECKRLGVKAFGGELDQRGLHHRAPARHAVPPRRERRHRQGPHAVRARSTGTVKFASKAPKNKSHRHRSSRRKPVTARSRPTKEPCRRSGAFSFLRADC